MSRRKALANNPLAPSSLSQSVEMTRGLTGLVGRPPIRAAEDWHQMGSRQRWHFGSAEVLETPEGLSIRIESIDAAEQTSLLEQILAFRKGK